MFRHLSTTLISVALAILPFSPLRSASEPEIIERWKTAVGSPQKLAGFHAIYREATIRVGGREGTIKAWHTVDGRYRKEERVGNLARIETFDGSVARLLAGNGPVQILSGPDLERAISSAYANVNAAFFAFFPQWRHGELTAEGADGIVMKPTGGIDWHVAFDPASGLPRTMVHQEGPRTITVTFVEFENIDGLTIEKEIHRAPGDPQLNAVIRFTRTIINPPIEPSLFTIQPGDLVGG